MITSPVGNVTEVTLHYNGKEDLDELHGIFHKSFGDNDEIYCTIKCYGRIPSLFSCKVYIPSNVFRKATVFSIIGLKRNLRDNTLHRIWKSNSALLQSSD